MRAFAGRWIHRIWGTPAGAACWLAGALFSLVVEAAERNIPLVIVASVGATLWAINFVDALRSREKDHPRSSS